METGRAREPLVKRGLVRRIFKAIAVTLGFAFISTVAVLFWAFRTGRAVEEMRQEIAVELKERCGVVAEFDTLTLDPLSLQMSLDELRMRHEDGKEIIAVDAAIVKLQLLPIFYGRLQLDQVALLKPKARIELVDGVPKNLPKCVQGSEDTKAPIVLGISALVVERGAVELAIDDEVEIQVEDIGIELAEGRSGGVDIALGTDVGRIRVGTSSHALNRVRVLGHLEGLLARPRAIVLDQLDVKVGRVGASGSGSIDLLGPVYEAKLTVEAPMSAVADFVPDVPPMSGDVALDVAIAGTAINPRAAGKLRIERGTIDVYEFGDKVDVDFAADRKGAKLNAIRIESGPGVVLAKGKVGFSKDFPFSVETEADQVSLGRVLQAVGLSGAWVDLRGVGTSTFDGKLNPLDIGGPFDYQLTRAHVFDGPWHHPSLKDKPTDALPPDRVMLAPSPIRAQGRWRFTLGGAQFSNLVVSAGATVGNADVDVTWGSGETELEIDASFPQIDFVDLGPLAGLAFGGYGTMSTQIFLKKGELGAVGAFDFKEVTIGGIPFGAASGTARWEDITQLDFYGIQGRLGQTRYSGEVGVTVEGEVPLRIAGEITNGRIEDVLIPFKVDGSQWGDPNGKLYARFDLFGPVRYLTGPVDLQLENIEVYGEKAQRGRAVGRMERGRIVVEDLDLVKYKGHIQGNGFIDPNLGNVRARVRTRKATLASIDLIKTTQPRLDGDMNVRLSLGGNFQGITGTLAASLSDVRAGHVALGNGKVDGKIRGATMFLKGFGIDGAATVDGKLGLTAGLPYEAKLTFNDVAAPNIVSGLQGHRDYEGRATGNADLRGSLIDWHLSSGKVFLESGKIDLATVHLETTGPTRFEMTRGVLATRRIGITGPRTRLFGEGKLGSRVIDMKVSGRLDMALAELLSDNVEKAGGNLVLDARVTGKPAAMSLVGAGRIERGFLKWSTFEERVTGLTADLTFSQSSVLIDRASARWASGKLEATGNVLLERYLPKRFNMNIKTIDVQPRMTFETADISGRINGLVTLSGSLDHVDIRGDVDVENGRARPKIDWANFVGSRRVGPVYDPSKEIVDFDVLFRMKEQFSIKNEEADVQLTGDVRLTGTNERWGMLGTATVVPGGRVAFIGREYTMARGTIEMADRYRFNPKFDLLLTAEACQARIRLNLLGTFENVGTNYASNPEMDQRDIVSCLIRGVKVTELDQDLGAFAGSALLKLSGVDREVKKVLPIDQIDVTTEYSSQARAYEPRVLIAKDLSVLKRPARLEYSSSLLRTNDQRAALKVRLTPRLNVQFGWTSSEDVPYGDWGLDLKQRWEW